MKITKIKNKSEYLEEQKEKANRGCNVCPCCGENKDSLYYLNKGILNAGIIFGNFKIWYGGIFLNKLYRIDYYICKTCGAEWQSEKYKIK